jgi:hypothetical protein
MSASVPYSSDAEYMRELTVNIDHRIAWLSPDALEALWNFSAQLRLAPTEPFRLTVLNRHGGRKRYVQCAGRRVHFHDKRVPQYIHAAHALYERIAWRMYKSQCEHDRLHPSPPPTRRKLVLDED